MKSNRIRKGIFILIIQMMLFISLYGIAAYAQNNAPVVPPIAVELPRYFNENIISIKGTTAPNSAVRLYVNDKTTPRRMLAAPEVPEGAFVFDNVALLKENEITIWVQTAAGVVTEKTFRITVDTQNPVVDLEPIPSLVTNKTLLVKGKTNEPVIIEVFLNTGTIDRTAPGKVTGLELLQQRANSIEIGWNASSEEDFSHYIIYRNGTAIATARSATYTTFTDIRVNANSTYEYRIAAADQSGNIGELSDVLVVVSLPEGRTDRRGWDEISQDTSQQPPIETLNVTDEFNVTLRLDRDGTYVLRLKVTDRAENTVDIENAIKLDTTLPEIEELEPNDGAFIYENVADDVDITGKTKPNATLTLFVNRSIFEVRDKDTYTTKADGDGDFKFRNVDLTRMFSGSLEPVQVSPSDLGSLYQGELQRTARKAKATIEVTDLQGRKATKELRYQIGNCWSGNLTWDVTPLTQYQSPSLLSTERLAAGTETIYFYINFSYYGIGADPKIESVSISQACDDLVKNDPRYNVSCRIMSSSCTTQSNADKTTWYIACPLRAYEEMNTWLKGDWNNFFNAIKSEMVFPFRLRVRYSHVVGGTRHIETQTMCQPVGYAVDNTKINFKDVLPDWLLYDTVDFLNSTIHDIDTVQEKVSDVLRITGISCIGSFAGRFAVQVYRRTICRVEEAVQVVNGVAVKISSSTTPVQIDAECSVDGKREKLKPQNELSNDCLAKYYPSCSKAWDIESKMYTLYRALCDRVFCHTTPSRWTESEASTTITTKLEDANTCSPEKSITGLSLRAQRCGDMPVYESLIAIKTNFNKDDTCFELRETRGSNVISTIFVLLKRNPIDSQGTVFEMVKLTDSGLTTESQPVIKINDNTYITNRPQTCSELCIGPGAQAAEKFVLEEGIPNLVKVDTKEGTAIYAGCFNTVGTQAVIGKPKIKIGDVVIENPEIVAKGYTKDCFINPDNFKQDDILNECFCISKQGEAQENYYTPQDFGLGSGQYDQMPWIYRYFREKWKAPSEATEYDPNRYIKGRDQTACFGQNNFLYKNELVTIDPFKQHTSAFQCGCISGINNRLLLIKNLMTSLQSCLIEVRETGSSDSGACKEIFSQFVCSLAWRAVSFFQDGCVNGQQANFFEKSDNQLAKYASAGLKGFGESINSLQSEFTEDYGNTQFSNLIAMGEETAIHKICLAAFGYDFPFDVQDALDVAYATPYATLVQAIEARREYLTYDPKLSQSKYEYRAGWIINPGCDMDDYDVELACITRNELDKYTGTDCSKQDDPKGVNCDCLNLDKERTVRYYDGRGIKQSVLENIGTNDIRDLMITSPYRYDHLKFTLRPDRGIGRRGAGIPTELRAQCFSDGHEDGVFYFPIEDRTVTDIASCFVDQTTGSFSCPEGALFFGQKPSGQLLKYSLVWETPDKKQDEQAVNDINNPITGRIEIPEGSSLSIKPEIWKAQGPDMCLHLSIKNVLGQEEGSPEGRFMPVTVSGAPFVYPPIKIADDLAVGRSIGIYVDKQENIDKRDIGSKLENSVNVGFKDANNDEKITISKDSTDVMVINGVEKTIKGWIDDKNASIEGNKLIIGSPSKLVEGLHIGIISVTLPLKPAELRKGADELEESIIFVFQSRLATTPATQEEKTINLELLHLKQGTDRYTNPDDCNTADIVQFDNRLQVAEPLKVFVVKK